MADFAGAGEAGGELDLIPPPPPTIPPKVKPEVLISPEYSITTRRGTGTTGRRMQLLANHFKVTVKAIDTVFYQYSVHVTAENKREVQGKGIGRKLVDRLFLTYPSELAGKKFVYDGEKALYTVGPLPHNKLEFTVVLEETFTKSQTVSPIEGPEKQSRRTLQSKTFTVQLSYAAKISLKSIALALKGANVENTQDALRVLDIILRQQAANMGCLLVRQSFFLDDSRNFTDVGAGVIGVRGFHSSFRPTQDVSTTMILTPGPVIDFLIANQGVREPRYIDWVKAKKMLKNMRIKTGHRNVEFKIIGISEKPCNLQYYPMKLKTGDGASEGETADITVFEYSTKHRGSELTCSQYLPCLDVGKPKRPNYLLPKVELSDSHSSLNDDDVSFRFDKGTTVGALLYLGGIVGFADSRRTSIESITNRESISDDFDKLEEISSTSHIYYLLCGDVRRCSFLVKTLSTEVKRRERHADFVTVDVAAQIAQAHLLEYFKSNPTDVDRTSEFGGVLIGWLDNKDYQAYMIMFADGEVKDLESLHYTKVSDSSSMVNQIFVVGSGGFWGNQFFSRVVNEKSNLDEETAKAIAKRLEYQTALNDPYSGGKTQVLVFRHQEIFNPTSRDIHEPLNVQIEFQDIDSERLLIIRITPFAAGIYMDFENHMCTRLEVECASLLLTKKGYNYYRVFCSENGKNTLFEYLMQRWVRTDGLFEEVRYALGSVDINVQVAHCTDEVLRSIAD